jgi:hypothetical protein
MIQCLLSYPAHCSHISATHNVQKLQWCYLQSHYTEATEACVTEWQEWWYLETDSRKIIAAEKKTLEQDVIQQPIVKEAMDDDDCMNL